MPDTADLHHGEVYRVSRRQPFLTQHDPLGSFDSRVVRQDTLDKLPELEKYAEKLLRQWTGGTSFKADRWTVTATEAAAVPCAPVPELPRSSTATATDAAEPL